jgi:hypothetical protein
VTRDLPQGNLEAAPDALSELPLNLRPTAPAPAATPTDAAKEGVTPNWGRWFRVISAEKLAGNTLMAAPQDRPLLVLDRVQKGRVAQLLSDQIWLWARGYENGGPQAELLRRLAHWLMKEPELEEERLMAEVASGDLRITRQTMADKAADVKITTPTGKALTVPLALTSPGRFTGNVKAEELGLYRLNDGTLNTVAAAGPLNPREVADMRATDEILRPYAAATGGGVQWISDGVPELRPVDVGATSSGSGWFGIQRRGAYRVTEVDAKELLPPWLALMMVLGTVLFAWRRESH